MLKRNFFIISLICLVNFSYAQLPNDCIDAIVVCGNSNVNLDVEGVGVLEAVNNTCSSGENNSLWLEIRPVTSGTLGFTLTPNSTAISEDYDFFVFGPNVTCDNLGNAIRCSTTNPSNANLNNNLTGMNGTETDTSEGPGSDGNSFVSWLNVNAGETYYIMIDRPIGGSPFSLEWTGTATFSNPPVSELPVGFDMYIEECDLDNDGLAVFDLTQFETDLVGSQNVLVNYFTTSQDAELNINQISNPNLYSSTTGFAYVRLTDTVTDCYVVFNIELNAIGDLYLIPPCTMYACDVSGFTQFDLETNNNDIINGQPNMQISYYLSENDANNFINPISSPYTNQSNPETIWVRLEDTTTGCFGIASFQLEVFTSLFQNPEPNFVNSDIIYCQDTYPENIELSLVLENNNPADFSFLWSTGETTQSISVNLAGEYSLEVINIANCSETIIFNVIGSSVFNSTEPNFKDETVYYCTDTYPQKISLFSGIENNNTTNFTFEWLPNGETTPDILINEIGDYTVNIYNSDNCMVSRTIHVLESTSPIVENILIADTKYPDRLSIEVITQGQGNYIYALDLEENEINNDTLFQEDNTFNNVMYGYHEVIIKDTNGCELLRHPFILLEYQKFITPNNDGNYDTWNIDNMNTSTKFKAISDVFIFDRYGRMVAAIKPNGLGWDGKYLGKVVNPDDYWFVVELLDYKGNKITKRGHFSVK